VKISIAILTKNAGHHIELLLTRLREQRISCPLEIVAVDSGSRDNTLPALRAAGAVVSEIPPRAFSFGPARQKAFEMSSGDVVVTMSQDVIPIGRDFLSQLINPIASGAADVVQGKTMVSPASDTFYWHRDSRLFYFTREAEDYVLANGSVKLSCECLAITRKAWESTGFGDAPYCEDKRIQVRLHRQGFRILKILDPIAYHDHRFTFVQLMKRCHNEGVGWRSASALYSTRRFVSDLVLAPFRFRRELIEAVLVGRLRTPAELLFFQVRPICVFIGNRFSRQLWW